MSSYFDRLRGMTDDRAVHRAADRAEILRTRVTRGQLEAVLRLMEEQGADDAPLSAFYWDLSKPARWLAPTKGMVVGRGKVPTAPPPPKRPSVPWPPKPGEWWLVHTAHGGDCVMQYAAEGWKRWEDSAGTASPSSYSPPYIPLCKMAPAGGEG